MTERPGAIVPIIPHKQAVRESVRFSEELLDGTTSDTLGHVSQASPFVRPNYRMHLRSRPFSQRIMKSGNRHKLTIQRALWQKSTSGGILGKVRAKLAVAGVSEQLETTPDDGAMEIMEEYLTHMDASVKVWAKESAALVKQSKESAKSLQATRSRLFGTGQETLSSSLFG